MANYMIGFIGLVVTPILAVIIILVVRHSGSFPNLVTFLTRSGIAGAVLTAIISFTRASIHIAPYELSRTAWFPVLGQGLLSLYIGFGLGVTIMGLVITPVSLFKMLLRKSKSEKRDPESVDGKDSEIK